MTDPERPRATPEGHTPEEPHPSELGKRGTPGAGGTDEVAHAADAHAEPRLGPIDWAAWSFAVLGALSGLIVLGLFWVASQPA